MLLAMRHVVAFILLGLLAPLTGCGGASVPSGTALEIFAENPSVGRAAFHLGCTPARGDLPDNASACAALASTPTLVTKPKPFTCFGGTFSWWDITISGRLDGRRIHHKVSTCWTPQMAMIDRLGLGRSSVLKSHLLPRGHQRLAPGVQRTFEPGKWVSIENCDAVEAILAAAEAGRLPEARTTFAHLNLGRESEIRLTEDGMVAWLGGGPDGTATCNFG
jgi:hypothetical protein